MIDDRAVEAAMALAKALFPDVMNGPVKSSDLYDGAGRRYAAVVHTDLDVAFVDAENLVSKIAGILAPFLTQIPDGCLNVGHQVVKTKGYPFPGEVRAVFKTRAGFVRYVVEATGEDYRGMLHIFDATQLALPPPPQERTDG